MAFKCVVLLQKKNTYKAQDGIKHDLPNMVQGLDRKQTIVAVHLLRNNEAPCKEWIQSRGWLVEVKNKSKPCKYDMVMV